MADLLIVDDDPDFADSLRETLEGLGHAVAVEHRGEDGLARLGAQRFELVFLDHRMPGMDGLQTLAAMKATVPRLPPVVVLTAHAGSAGTIEAMRLGAFDHLTKPVSRDGVIEVVRRALAASAPPPAAPVRAPAPDDGEMIGISDAMREVHKRIGLAVGSRAPVLVVGETGTGKELVARALHDYGKRRTGPFVAINMAAIPRELIEAELFGHERGAFTGALARGVGRFEQAAGGTLFLDEIGDMPPEAQTRLLRVLQEGEFTTVGGRQPIKANVRIIAATHRDLRQAIRAGTFREDLFYRLNVVPIRLPPLRERLEDIPLLARHFLERARAAGLPGKTLDEEAMERLKDHSWPGNARELENLMRRLAALYPQEVIGADAVAAELTETESSPALPGEPRSPETLEQAVERHLHSFLGAHRDGMPVRDLYERVVSEVERPLIRLALAATRGNQIKAAAMLGLNRNTLRKKIRELELPVVRGLS